MFLICSTNTIVDNGGAFANQLVQILHMQAGLLASVEGALALFKCLWLTFETFALNGLWQLMHLTLHSGSVFQIVTFDLISVLEMTLCLAWIGNLPFGMQGGSGK